VRARAAVAVVGAAGRDRLATLRSDPPLTLRPVPARPGTAGRGREVYLVGTSAGPLAGDDLRLDLSIGARAALTVRSVAATLVQPGAPAAGPAGRGPSVLRIDARVGAVGRLVWVPEPTVAVRGCDHETVVRIGLDPGATLVWRDEVVLGRHGEETGSVLARLAVDRAGMPLLRNDLAVGPRWPGSRGPAGVGSVAGAVGSALVVGPGAAGVAADPPARPGVRAAVLAVADDAVLVTVVAVSAGALSAALDAALAATVGACAAGDGTVGAPADGAGGDRTPVDR
jgi:urease accessory protein